MSAPTGRRAAVAAERCSGRSGRGGRARRTGPALAVVAVLLLVAGALLATALRPVERTSATVPTGGGDPLVVLSPSLLAGRTGSVEVTASGDGPVLVAAGRADDVAAWAQGTATTTATDLDDHGAAEVQRADGAEPAPDPSGSDLWTAQERGDGSARLALGVPQAGGATALAVLVASDGSSPAPSQVEVTWSDRPVPLAAWALLVAGVLVGLAVLWRGLRAGSGRGLGRALRQGLSRRRRRRRDVAAPGGSA